MSAVSIAYALLSGAGAVTAIVSTRIYPVELPEGIALPAIVIDSISNVRAGAIDADRQFRNAAQIPADRGKVDIPDLPYRAADIGRIAIIDDFRIADSQVELARIARSASEGQGQALDAIRRPVLGRVERPHGLRVVGRDRVVISERHRLPTAMNERLFGKRHIPTEAVHDAGLQFT